MADDDKLCDARGRIINVITDEISNLFTGERTPHNWPQWVQAAMLLEKAVIPCDYYVPEKLIEVAKNIVEEGKRYGPKVEYYQVKDGKKINVIVEDYTALITIIQEWIRTQKKEKELLVND